MRQVPFGHAFERSWALKTIFGMVARIDPVKGQHTFLEMASLVIEHIPSARFLLAGDDTVALLQDVFRFLGVDDRFVPDTSNRLNVSMMIPGNRVLHDLIEGN
jgi:glycosyltransferase involved in cell wall biosynthesis